MSKKIIVIDKSDGHKLTKTAQGFLRVDGYVTRTGVLKYTTPDGQTIRQLRDPKEIFNKDSLETLKGIPVTLRHPPKLITTKDVKQYMVGFSSFDIEPVGNKIKTQLTITDDAAIQSVENEDTVELSCGYECELEESQGTFDGEQYDFIQRNVKYNHIALVKKGRAGADVRVLMDAEDSLYVHDESVEAKTTQEKPIMEKVMINGQEFEVAPELAAALKAHMEKMQAEMDGMKPAVAKEAELLKEKEVAQAKMDAMNVEIENLKKDLSTKMDSTDESKVAERVKARISLIETAKRFVADGKFEEMTDLDIKKTVITSDLSSINLDGKSEDYVNASFDYIVERTKASDDQKAKLGKKLTAANKDSAVEESSEEARKKSMQLSQDAWKQPLNK